MNLRELTTIYFKGDEAAVNFIVDLFASWHIWDDLIDKDKPVSDEDVNLSFINAYIKLPRNYFYQANFKTLNPLMENAILSWMAANQLEKNKENLELSYALRNNYLSIITACAGIIGGDDWAIEVAIDVQKKMAKNDSFEAYAKELNSDKSKE